MKELVACFLPLVGALGVGVLLLVSFVMLKKLDTEHLTIGQMLASGAFLGITLYLLKDFLKIKD